MADCLICLNGLIQSVSLSVNVAAARSFIYSGSVIWSAALVVAVGALLGGTLGGRVAGRIKPSLLRWIVVSIGAIARIIDLLRL